MSVFLVTLLLSGHAVAVDAISRDQLVKELETAAAPAAECYFQFSEPPQTSDLQEWAAEMMRLWGMVADAIVMNDDHVALRALLKAYVPPEGGSESGGFPHSLEEKYKRALQLPPESRQAVMYSMMVLMSPYGGQRDELDAKVAITKLIVILARASGCEIDEALTTALSKAERISNSSNEPPR